MLKGFGFANAFKRIRARVLDQVIDLFALLLILRLPKRIVAFELGRMHYPESSHFSRKAFSMSSAESKIGKFPLSASSSAVLSRLAFAFDPKR